MLCNFCCHGLESTNQGSLPSPNGRHGKASHMYRTKVIFIGILLAISGLASSKGSSQTLTKCAVLSRPLILQNSVKPLRLSGPITGNKTIEYHLKVKADLNATVRLAANDRLTLDVYLVNPPTAFSKNDKYAWSGRFSKGNEYVVAISNCSSRLATKFQLDIVTR